MRNKQIEDQEKAKEDLQKEQIANIEDYEDEETKLGFGGLEI